MKRLDGQRATALPVFNIRLVVACVLIAIQVGCRDRSAEFIPELTTARSALDRGLNAWKAGKSPGEVADSKPAVYVTDTNRKPGQILSRFEILGETSGRSGRTFAVSLYLSKPTEKLKTEYIVVGIDPIWVFRREDYELLMHWDHHMPKNPQSEASTEK